MRNHSGGLSRFFVYSGIFSAIVLCISSVVSAESFDWRNVNGSNWDTSVKGQFGGTCWDFSACGSLEAKYKLTRNDPNFNPDVSEQHINWETNPDMGSTGGGWASGVLDYFTYHGVVSEAECPVQGTDEGAPPYWPLATGWENRVWKSVSNQNSIPNDIATIKSYLKQFGPMAVGISAGNDMFASVADLKANYRAADASICDHEVSLVAFYDDPTTPSGGYWIIKNSWGPGDGDGTGHDYIPYGNIEIHTDINAITGAVYYTGSMATASWSGGAGTWASGNSTKWSGYAWENKETSATFAGTGGAVTLSGTVIAHGMTVNSTGYTFSGGALTVTSGGITANQSTTISSPLYIGGPQTWTVASGRTLTVSGALHTIISNTTISGAGNVAISGAIDGGGVLNTYGAKPGGLIKNNTGTMTLTGVSNFGGDITVNTGTLSLNPSASSTYSGAFFGSGTLSLGPTSAATISIGGGNSNYTGPISIGSNATLAFVPTAGVLGTFSGRISGTSRPVIQNGPGTTRLTGANTYTGSTTIQNGALQANSGAGLPSSSMLILKGGVLQGEGTVTFTRTLSSTAGSNRFYWASGTSGGFAAGSGNMNVRINNGTSTINFGGTVGSTIQGSLILSSSTSNGVTTFENGLNLNGSYQGVIVNDNPTTTADYAVISGVISNSTGTAGFSKMGDGPLVLTGSNTYNGNTIIGGGILAADVGTGVPTNSLMILNGGVFEPTTATTFTKSLGTGNGQVCWNPSGAGGGIAAHGSNLSVNINNNTSTLVWGTVQGTNIIGPLMLNSAHSVGSLTFNNGLDLAGGPRTILVAGSTATLTRPIIGATGSSLTKSGVGTLVMNGSSANTYSGSTTIKGGTLDLNSTSGVAIPGDLVFTGPSTSCVRLIGSNQIASTAKLSWSGGTAWSWQYLKLYGHNLTVSSITDLSGYGAIENTETETGYGDATVTVQNNSDCTYFGYIRNSSTGSGVVSLTKNGTGTLTLGNGGVYYTGPTQISSGKLVLQDCRLFASPITNNGSLELRTIAGDCALSQPISGTGPVTKNGFRSFYYTGSAANTYTGATTVTDGLFWLSKDNGVCSIPGALNITATTAAHTWVVLNADNQFAASSTANFSSSLSGAYALLVLNGHDVTLAGINDTTGAGIIENTQNTPAANCTLTVNNSVYNTYNGYIFDTSTGIGTLALNKTGPAVLALGGPGGNTYTGGTTITGGQIHLYKTSGYAIPGDVNISSPNGGLSAVVLFGDNQIAPTSNFNFQGGNWPMLLLNGHNTTLASINDSYGTGIIENTQDSAAGACTLTVNNAAACTYNGYIFDTSTGSGSLALMKTGAGILTLGGPGGNTYTGVTAITGGQIFCNKTAGYAIPGNVNISAPSGITAVVLLGDNQIAPTSVFNFQGGSWPILLLNGHNTTLAGINDSNGTGIIENTQETSAGNCSLTINNATNCSFNGYIRNTSTGSGLLAIIKNGVGTLTLSGNNANDFTGGLIINAGTVDFENTENDVAHPYTVNSGGHLVLNGVQLAAAASAMSLIAASATDDYANTVPDTNNGTMSIVGSTYFNARNLVGTGTLKVQDDAVVYAHSLVQDTLVIGGTSSYSPAVAVPEPGTMMLLAFGVLALVGVGIGRKNRG
jgi:autotransporter-associated beta strand protein